MNRDLREKIERADEPPAQDFGDGEKAPFYERIPTGKLRPDHKAIANLDSLPRPKAPPRRAPEVSEYLEQLPEHDGKLRLDEFREAIVCAHPDCSLCGGE